MFTFDAYNAGGSQGADLNTAIGWAQGSPNNDDNEDCGVWTHIGAQDVECHHLHHGVLCMSADMTIYDGFNDHV